MVEEKDPNQNKNHTTLEKSFAYLIAPILLLQTKLCETKISWFQSLVKTSIKKSMHIGFCSLHRENKELNDINGRNK